MKAHFKMLLCFCRIVACLYSNPSGLHSSWLGVLQLLLMLVFGSHICLTFSCQPLKNARCSVSLVEMGCYYGNKISMATLFFHLWTLFTLDRSQLHLCCFLVVVYVFFVFTALFFREKILKIVIYPLFSCNS